MIQLLSFLLALGILISVHEWGHYRVARACGVKVLRFSIGFGRVLWRRQIGDTEWVLSMIPLGGYVRMLDEREGPVDPNELHRAFTRKSLWQRAAIVAAGPVANLVLAVLLYAGASWVGMLEPRAVLGSPSPTSVTGRAGLQAGDWVRRWQVTGESDWRDVLSLDDLNWQMIRAALDAQDLMLEVTSANGSGRHEVLLPLASLGAKEADRELGQRIGLGGAFQEPVLGSVSPEGAAARAGLKEGDRVLRVDGQPVPDGLSLRQLIRMSGAKGDPPLQTWLVERAGRTLTIEVKPLRVEDHGQFLGRISAVVGAMPQQDLVALGFAAGLQRGWDRTVEMAGMSLKIFGRMLIGQASLKNLSGPVAVADFVGKSAEHGLSSYLVALAVLSVSLGVLNLLPVPVLDGGHLLYYLVEGITGRPVTEPWLSRLQRAGLTLILLMMSLALYNDLAPRLGLH